MSRQSAFPGIFISSIEVEKPPFDEPGVIQEFVGRGVIHEFEMMRRASDITEENIGEVITSVEELIGPLRDSFRVKYNLRVKAAVGQFRDISDLMIRIQKRSVKSRARLFVRVKNPFEPDILEVTEPELNEELSIEEIGNVYNVTVTVTK